MCFITGLWKLVKKAQTLKICSLMCNSGSGNIFKILNSLMCRIPRSTSIRLRAIHLVSVASAAVSWARLAVRNAEMWRLQPHAATSSAKIPLSAIMALPGWSKSIQPAQGILLSLDCPSLHVVYKDHTVGGACTNQKLDSLDGACNG